MTKLELAVIILCVMQAASLVQMQTMAKEISQLHRWAGENATNDSVFYKAKEAADGVTAIKMRLGVP